ncbi:MAG: class I SAM-dependent methyltransferase [Desulfuromonadaceae bacterium]|nr:class I SAM-dependent methyltransferase [Desulfuromonadaceae bacterium]MDD5106475.1 class I SAM-dependent methyltransferase [Desulfuromonadaceae bacterium]
MTHSSAPFTSLLRGPVPLSHLFLRCFVRSGDHAVDATCGNGHDTLLLAQLVGVHGHTWGFDIQPEAIAETGRRLDEAKLAHRVTLVLAGHEYLAEHVTLPVRAVLFNLGYRPGGERSIITRPDTTVAALEQALHLLLPGGIVAVTIYPGHDGGSDEQSAIEQWTTRLEPQHTHIWRMGQINVSAAAPYLLLIQKFS